MQRRTVQCLAGARPASDCPPHQKPEASLACNTHFCPITEKKGELRASWLGLGIWVGAWRLGRIPGRVEEWGASYLVNPRVGAACLTHSLPPLTSFSFLMTVTKQSLPSSCCPRKDRWVVA